jgi:hypothetical protein
MHRPTTRPDQQGIGRGPSIAIIIGVLLAAVAVHSVGGGPARFLETSPDVQAAALMIGHAE